MMGKKCVACQAEMDPDAIFCNECGHAHPHISEPMDIPGASRLPSTPEPVAHRSEITPPSAKPEVAEAQNSRTCPNCGKSVAVAFRYCPACAHNFFPETSQAPDRDRYLSGPVSRDGTPISSVLVNAAKSRYQNAYYYARFIDNVGKALKVIGFVGGGLIFLGGLVVLGGAPRSGFNSLDASVGGLAILVFSIYSAVWIFFWWIWGVLWRSAGQFLKASLDGAVHNSPFLTDLERAEVMSLPVATSSSKGPGASPIAAYPKEESVPKSNLEVRNQVVTWYESTALGAFQTSNWFEKKLGPLKAEKAALLCYLGPIVLPALAFVLTLILTASMGETGYFLGMLVLLASPFGMQSALLKVKRSNGVSLVRFHAYQSILEVSAFMAGSLIILGVLYLRGPQIDGSQGMPPFILLLGIGHVFLLIFMCVKADSGLTYKLPLIGEWAENFTSNVKPKGSNYMDLK